jgi:hypothetical protein
VIAGSEGGGSGAGSRKAPWRWPEVIIKVSIFFFYSFYLPLFSNLLKRQDFFCSSALFHFISREEVSTLFGREGEIEVDGGGSGEDAIGTFHVRH